MAEKLFSATKKAHNKKPCPFNPKMAGRLL